MPKGLGVNISRCSTDDGWTSPPPVTLGDGTLVQLYKDGQALRAGLDAISRAQLQVCLEVYIFSDDPTGHTFMNALIERARAGVRVFLLCDDFGTPRTMRKPMHELKQAGGFVRMFHPLLPWENIAGWRPLNRDHRKLLIIDGQIAGVGGLNVAGEYAGPWLDDLSPAPHLSQLTQDATPTAHPQRKPGHSARGRVLQALRRTHDDPWRDTAVGIVGPAVRHLHLSFAHTWRYAGRGGPISRTQLIDLAATPDFGIVASAPTLSSRLLPTLHDLLASARSSIHLTVAYFAPDDALIEALCAASRRGVSVFLMLPNRSDVPAVITAGRFFYDKLMHAGVHIYERLGAVLHAKTLVIDSHTSVIGSMNLDYRSIEYNLELSVVIRNHDLGRQMIDMFKNDQLYATKIDIDTWRKRPYYDRLGQWAVSRARYLL